MATRGIIGMLAILASILAGGFALADSAKITTPDGVLAELLAGNTRYLEGRIAVAQSPRSPGRTCCWPGAAGGGHSLR